MKETIYNKTKPEKTSAAPEKQEKESRLAELWRRYRFFGQPPKEGSPVAQRLHDTCESYIKSIMKSKSGGEKVSENALAMIESSDAYRRELHNQIALMALGHQRSDLDDKRSAELRDFACQLAYGCAFDQLVEDSEKINQKL
jgi:hypothetical protein